MELTINGKAENIDISENISVNELLKLKFKNIIYGEWIQMSNNLNTLALHAGQTPDSARRACLQNKFVCF